MNDPLRPCRKGRVERVRLARSGWRPAKHIYTRYPWRRATLSASIGQIPILEDRGECGARRTALRPGWSRSPFMPVLRPIKFGQTDVFGQNVGKSDATYLQSMSYNPEIICNHLILRDMRKYFKLLPDLGVNRRRSVQEHG